MPNPRVTIRGRRAQWLGLELRTFARKLFRPGTVKLRGLELEVDRARWSGPLLNAFDRERYESAEADILEATLTPEDRLLELGTGAGFLGMVASRILAPSRFRSYEANPEVVAMARRNHARNDVELDIRNSVVLPAGDERTEVPFYTGDDFWTGSLIPPAGEYRESTVPAVPLADVLAEFRPTYMAVDIEGGEIALFQDSELPGVQKLLIELHGKATGIPARDALVRHFLDIGFDIGFEHGRGEAVYFERRREGAENGR